MNNSQKEENIVEEGVASSCYKPIKIILDTLLLNKKCKQQDLADSLDLDKSYISRIVNGLEIPPLRIRLKIADFFHTDSCLIWRFEDLPHIRKLKEKQEKRK